LKFKAIPNSRRYLKKGVTFKKLNQIMSSRNPNQMAGIVNTEREMLFNKIFALNNSPSGSSFN